MSIGITNNSGSTAAAVTKSQSEKTAAKNREQDATVNTGASSGAKVQEDSVNLTSSASLLQQLEANIEQQPVVNAEAVAKVQQQISDGTYEIDYESTAGKLLERESELTGS